MITYLDILLNEEEPCTLAQMLFEDYDGDEYAIIEFLSKLGIICPTEDASKLASLANKIVLTQEGKIAVYNFLKEHDVFHLADLPDFMGRDEIGGLFS